MLPYTSWPDQHDTRRQIDSHWVWASHYQHHCSTIDWVGHSYRDNCQLCLDKKIKELFGCFLDLPNITLPSALFIVRESPALGRSNCLNANKTTPVPVQLVTLSFEWSKSVDAVNDSISQPIRLVPVVMCVIIWLRARTVVPYKELNIKLNLRLQDCDQIELIVTYHGESFSRV